MIRPAQSRSESRASRSVYRCFSCSVSNGMDSRHRYTCRSVPGRIMWPPQPRQIVRDDNAVARENPARLTDFPTPSGRPVSRLALQHTHLTASATRRRYIDGQTQTLEDDRFGSIAPMHEHSCFGQKQTFDTTTGYLPRLCGAPPPTTETTAASRASTIPPPHPHEMQRCVRTRCDGLE